MQYYQTKVGKIRGSGLKEVADEAFDYFLAIKRKSKRKPYIRSIIDFWEKQKKGMSLWYR